MAEYRRTNEVYGKPEPTIYTPSEEIQDRRVTKLEGLETDLDLTRFQNLGWSRNGGDSRS